MWILRLVKKFYIPSFNQYKIFFLCNLKIIHSVVHFVLIFSHFMLNFIPWKVTPWYCTILLITHYICCIIEWVSLSRRRLKGSSWIKCIAWRQHVYFYWQHMHSLAGVKFSLAIDVTPLKRTVHSDIVHSTREKASRGSFDGINK